jgi:hypothetical protein
VVLQKEAKALVVGDRVSVSANPFNLDIKKLKMERFLRLLVCD